MDIHWGALGTVLVAALGVTVGVVVLFSLGVAAWSRATATAPAQGLRGRPAGAVALLCFAACLAVAGYAIDVIVPG
ncbi:hypothetical protein POF50_006720 [Streptomyces sp. SL13]|uniref:Uncharacterized protein n=1 Tax=Streptantibioticus silvisoli TaxID=2705255 RepID=A0AA90JWF5_9ACTN|nr:hypothetical protein [Streptantibioticus silvisoli]MDI5964395.1 hypothetical protein [Streptantibioticus silvisoli]MDI5969041.1 hypothetical protein [Streptantibioticus silvisoli]